MFAALAGGFFTTEPLGKPGSEGRVLLTGLSRIGHQGGPRRAETSLGPWEFGGSSQEAEPPPTTFFFFFSLVPTPWGGFRQYLITYAKCCFRKKRKDTEKEKLH